MSSLCRCLCVRVYECGVCAESYHKRDTLQKTLQLQRILPATLTCLCTDKSTSECKCAVSENMCVSVSVQVCVCIHVFMNYILITFVLEQFGFGKQKVGWNYTQSLMEMHVNKITTQDIWIIYYMQ